MIFSPTEWDAIRLSLIVSAWSVIISLPIALVTAWVLARMQFPGKIFLNGLIHLPLVLPPVVTGFALLLLFGRRGPIGQLLEQYFGIILSFRWTGAVLAAAVMSFPLMVRPIRLSIEMVDRKLEQAALTLGASPFWVFLTITLPLTLPGILAGAVLGFAKALGEFGATITFVSNIPGETRTLPSAIYTFTQIPNGDAGALRLSLIAALIALLALLISELLAQQLQKKLQGR